MYDQSKALASIDLDTHVRVLLAGGHVVEGTVGESDDYTDVIVVHTDSVAYRIPHSSVLAYGVVFSNACN